MLCDSPELLWGGGVTQLQTIAAREPFEREMVAKDNSANTGVNRSRGPRSPLIVKNVDVHLKEVAFSRKMPQ